MTDTETPSGETEMDREVKQANIEKAHEETRKLAAETMKAQFEALTLNMPKELPSGALNVSGATTPPASVLAVYRGVKEIAEAIGSEVGSDPAAVWIVSSADADRSHRVYEAVAAQVERLTASIRFAKDQLSAPHSGAAPSNFYSSQNLNLVAPAIMGAAGTLFSLATSALPLLAGLMKTSTTVKTSDVKVPFTALSALLANSLSAKPGAGRVSIDGVTVSTNAALLDELHELESVRDDLAGRLEAFKADRLVNFDVNLAAKSARLDGLKTLLAGYAKADPPTDTKILIDEIEQAALEAAKASQSDHRDAVIVASVEKALSTVDQFLQQVRAPDTNGESPLSVAVEYAAHRGDRRLFAEVSYAGIESQWEELAARKDRGLHIGVAVVTYILSDDAGNVLKSGAIVASESATTRMGEGRIEWVK